MVVKAGKLRPSQAVTQSGPGSLVDLPTLSMVIAAADEWDLSQAPRVDEPRLARRLGVDAFREPPFFKNTTGTGGIKARVFPQFLVCPRCNRLATHDAFEFNSRRAEHICKASDCRGGGKTVAYPVRFMVACPRGHLSDFPWHSYIHPQQIQCAEELRLEDSGQTGAITDLWVKCPTHNVSRNLGQAFGIQNRRRLPKCNGHRPWLGDYEPCDEEVRVLLRGASNAYFPIVESAISIPPWSDPIQLAVGQYYELWAQLDTLGKLRQWLELSNVPGLKEFSPEQLWDALQRRRAGVADFIDLRVEEWRAFQVEPASIHRESEFQSLTVAVPEGFTPWIARVVLLERMREVRALRGFTRIDPIPDIGDMEEVEAVQAGMAPIMKGASRWLPGVEFRGEGILIQLNEESVRAWESREPVRKMWARHSTVQAEWHRARGLPFKRPRPARYILLHSLAHLLIRQLALDAGYSSASLRERIYSSTDSTMPMAGILIYTATPDSEGSLGGLVEQGRPENLRPLLEQALDDARLCANDPLCADREPTAAGNQLNGAACHACLLASETACEAGNRHLDRSVLVGTLRESSIAFVAR